MKKNQLIFLLTLCLVFFACEKETINNDPSNPDEQQETSKYGALTYVGQVGMEQGPHDLLINGDKLFAKRDHRLYMFSLSNPASPTLTNEYTQPQAYEFGKLYMYQNKLYACNKSENVVYVFNSNLNYEKKLTVDYYNFRPNTMYIDAQGIYWIGGSDGAYGTLVKGQLSGNTINVLESWSASFNQSNMEQIEELNNHVVASIATGDFLTFDKTNINDGPVSSTTYENEAGHSKWGKRFVIRGNRAYWANWGAGMATIDLANISNPYVYRVLTDSKVKAQEPDVGGADFYDVAYNEDYDYLCISNGWSGLLLVSPSEPDKIIDFIKPPNLQHYSIETKGNYIYIGNISGGYPEGNQKGLKIFKLN